MQTQFRYKEALTHFEIVINLDLGTIESYRLNYRLMEIILLAKSGQKNESNLKYQEIQKD